MDSRKNKHLNAFERGQIQLLLKDGLSVYAIAKRLAQAYNTVRNEIRRGTVTQIKGEKKVEIYYPDTAPNRYEEALLTLTEGLTRKEIIRKISGKNSAAVMRALNPLIICLPTKPLMIS